MLKTILTLALCLLTAVAFSQSIQEKIRDDKIEYVNSNDSAMQRAYQKARAGLPDFLAKLANPSKDTDMYSVKVGVKDGKNTEYFWIADIVRRDGKFSGVIDNDAELVTNVKIGQKIDFVQSEIVDWTYLDQKQRKMFGNFTMCAMLLKESKSDAEDVQRKLGLTCEL